MDQSDDPNRPGTPCDEAAGLLAKYHESLRAYRAAVNDMNAELPHQEFESSYDRAEEARVRFEQKREDLQRHVFVHGCQRSLV